MADFLSFFWMAARTFFVDVRMADLRETLKAVRFISCR